MGLEFIHTKAQTFQKAVRKAVATLSIPDLLQAKPNLQEQLVLFELLEGSLPPIGDELLCQVDGLRLMAIKGATVIGVAVEPPARIVESLNNSHGFGIGRVSKTSDRTKTFHIAFAV